MRISQQNEDCQGQTHYKKTPQTRSQEPHDCVSQKFPKTSRLLKKKDYHAFSKSASRLLGDCLVIDYRMGKSVLPRIGITVSKKYGKAHDRNRFKRVVREAYRSLYVEFPDKLEINVIPRFPMSKVTKQDILSELRKLLVKISP